MRWRKVGVVAATEFNTAVRSKAFLISVLFLPIIMGASIVLQTVVASRADTSPKRIAVIDRSGALLPTIEEAAKARNDGLASSKPEAVDGREEAGAPYYIEGIEPGDRPRRELLLELSERVRGGELEAFAEVPADAVAPAGAEPSEIDFYSANPNDSAVLNWLKRIVNFEVRDRRLRAAGIDPDQAALLSRPVMAESLTLLEGGLDGSDSIRGGEKVDRIRSMLVPAALMFIVFMVVMSSTPQLLQSVIEEKMSRISPQTSVM